MRGFGLRDVVDTYVILKEVFDKRYESPLPDMTPHLEGEIARIIEGVSSKFGHDPYPGTIRKAVALFYNAVKNHGLGDGNKRLAVIILLSFLDKRRYHLLAAPKTLYEWAIWIAKSDSKDREKIMKKLVKSLSWTFIRKRSASTVKYFDDLDPNDKFEKGFQEFLRTGKVIRF